MSKPTKTNALEIIAQAQIGTSANLENISVQCITELEYIAKMEGAAALRALRFGLVMHQAKALLPHGQFLPWQQKTFLGRSGRACRYYMRLAIVFIEAMRLNKAEVLSLPGAQLELALDKQDTSTRSVLEKATVFIGEHSLNELLIKHDIKAVGLKNALENEKEAIDESNLPIEHQIRLRRERLFGRTTEYLTHLRKSLASVEDVQLLEPSQLELIKSDLLEIGRCLEAARTA